MAKEVTSNYYPSKVKTNITGLNMDAIRKQNEGFHGLKGGELGSISPRIMPLYQT